MSGRNRWRETKGYAGHCQQRWNRTSNAGSGDAQQRARRGHQGTISLAAT